MYDTAMEKTREKKRGFTAIWKLCPVRHSLLLLNALIIILHLATRGNYVLNRWLSAHFVRPVHRFLSLVTDVLPFSLAAMIYALAIIGGLVYIIFALIRIVLRKEWGKQLYVIFMTLLTAGAVFYGSFCLLWGVFYYGDDFMAQSGLKNDKISTEQLAETAAWYA